MLRFDWIEDSCSKQGMIVVLTSVCQVGKDIPGQS